MRPSTAAAEATSEQVDQDVSDRGQDIVRPPSAEAESGAGRTRISVREWVRGAARHLRVERRT